MAKLLNAAIEEMKYHIDYLNQEYPNWFRYSPFMTQFSMKDMKLSNTLSEPKGHEITSVKNEMEFKRQHVLNNVSKPKAKKTFPNALNSNNCNNFKDKKCNSFEITNISLDSTKKYLKPKPEIEIIEFKSKPINCVKTESNDIKKNRIKAQNIVNIETKSERNDFETEEIAINTDFSINNRTDLKPNVTDVNQCQTKHNVNEVDDKYVRLKSDNIINNDKSLEMNTLVNKLKQKINYLEKKFKKNELLYQTQIIQMQQKSDLELELMKRSLEEDKQRAIVDERNKQIAINSQLMSEKKKKFETTVIELTDKHNLEIKSLEQKWIQKLKECKTKIWCFNCLEEAQLFCCSHTYYCSTDCQQRHWDQHKKICVQPIDSN